MFRGKENITYYVLSILNFLLAQKPNFSIHFSVENRLFHDVEHLVLDIIVFFSYIREEKKMTFYYEIFELE